MKPSPALELLEFPMHRPYFTRTPSFRVDWAAPQPFLLPGGLHLDVPVALRCSRRMAVLAETVPNACWANAIRVGRLLARLGPALYAEGWAETEPGCLLQHGWVVTPEGIVDATPRWVPRKKTRTARIAYYPVVLCAPGMVGSIRRSLRDRPSACRPLADLAPHKHLIGIASHEAVRRLFPRHEDPAWPAA